MDNQLDQFMEDHLNYGYGNVMDELATDEQYADEYEEMDEPWDETLAQQELEDFEQCDEYFGCFGGDDW